MKEIYKIIIISFLIYTWFFYKLGNTIFRMDENGFYKFNLASLFYSGFIGPIKTIYFLFFYNINSLIPFIFFEFFRLSNPYSALIFTLILKNLDLQRITIFEIIYIHYIIKTNF